MSLWYSIIEVNNMEKNKIYPPGVCMNPKRLLYHNCEGCQFVEEADCQNKANKKKIKSKSMIK